MFWIKFHWMLEGREKGGTCLGGGAEGVERAAEERLSRHLDSRVGLVMVVMSGDHRKYQTVDIYLECKNTRPIWMQSLNSRCKFIVLRPPLHSSRSIPPKSSRIQYSLRICCPRLSKQKITHPSSNNSQ